MDKKIILASQSPRRKEILERIGTHFEVRSADIDEIINEKKDLKQELCRIALEKANAVRESSDEIIISADTIVLSSNEVLGKPKSKAEAKKMLRKLSGIYHFVLTAVCLVSSKRIECECIETKVYFNPLTEEEINQYIETNEPMDKAGAYGIQGIGGCFVSRIDGDYTAVMGLPLSWVYKNLKEEVEI